MYLIIASTELYELVIFHLCFPMVEFCFWCFTCGVCSVHSVSTRLIVPKLSPFIRHAARAEYLILNSIIIIW